MPSITDERVSDRLTQPMLRDLAWLMDAPDLIELPGPMPCDGRPSREELGLSGKERGAWLDWLQRLAPRLAALGNGATRLGHYHERLWHLLLDTAPNTRLLARNLRITERRKTLGELDMLYRRLDDPTPVHLEVAIKFYLGLPEGPGSASSQSRWIGPGGLDSLAIKRQHLACHQLPISATQAAQTMLKAWLAPRDCGDDGAALLAGLTQRLAMPGVLFYPYHAALPAPRGATPDHRRGRWCRVADWSGLAAEKDAPLTLAWLAKPHWLAPPPAACFQPAARLIPALLAQVHERGPQQVMLQSLSATGEACLERLFIVPDDWPGRIPLPPRTA